MLSFSVLAVPSSVPPAQAEPVPAYRVEPGTVLVAEPPAFTRPVHGYRLTGRFGDASYHWRSSHTGLDFAAPSGTPIRSMADGVVVSSGYDGRYGTTTVVRLRSGVEIWYCHQDATSVEAGERVRVGQRIGSVGSTGNVTGPHLHLEVRTPAGEPVDPYSWLRARGVPV